MAARIVRKREPLRYWVRTRQRAIWSCRHGLLTEPVCSTSLGGPGGLDSEHRWTLCLRRPPRRVRSGLGDHVYFWRRQTSYQFTDQCLLPALLILAAALHC